MPLAARVGDMHVCPMVTGVVPHVGGPVLPAGCPTVLIGGMPAARVSDMCVCVGPPDAIAMGSVTVLIGNMMAARMGDPTVHGGVITIGCPTVIIGDSGSGGGGGGGGPMLNSLCPAIGSLDAMSPSDRAAAEQQIANQIAQTDPALAKPLNQLRHDRDMAMLSSAAYSPTAPLPSGYSVAGQDDYDKLGISPAPDISVYKTETPTGQDHYVVAFRGTATAGDAGTDLMQGMGYQTDAYDRATDAGREARASGQSVEFTGHSKGGGQAALASAVSGDPGTTFNAAGVHPNTFADAGVTPDQQDALADNLRAYNNERDPLNNAQDNRKVILGGGAAGALATGMPGVAGFLAGTQISGGLPQASGQRIVVPAAKGQASGLSIDALKQGHSIDTMVQAMNELVDRKLKETCGC